MNLLSITRFNMNPQGGASGKPFFLTAMILLGVAALAVALFIVVPAQTAQANHDLDPPGRVTPIFETDTSILVEWTAPSDEALVTHYLIRWKLSSESTFDSSDQTVRSKTERLTQDITGLTKGTSYDIEVYSCADSDCVHRSTNSASTTHSTPTPLPEPVNFRVLTTATSAKLTWDAPTGTLFHQYGHKLSSATEATDWTTAGNLSERLSEEATVYGLETGMTYDFRVRACRSNGTPVGCSAYVTVLHRAALSPQATYDTDGDGFIEISHLVQLNALRWDLDGNGAPDTEADQYNGAFPVTIDGSVCSTRTTCTGYELMADLDFDTGTVGDRTDDIYYNTGAGWEPIPHFNATFDGRGHTISNLFINATGTGHVGLFGTLRPDKTIRRLGLVDANVTFSQSTGDIANATGGIVGRNLGKIETSYVTGEVRGGRWVGGLVGLNGTNSTVNASYSNASVTGRADDSAVGGIVGSNLGTIKACYATGNVDGVFVGGLVGSYSGGTITASYATGTVDASTIHAGGLVGISSSDANTTENYWDTGTSGVARSAGGTGQTAADLQRPTGYSGIYSTWNDDGTDYWDFGTSTQYPALKVDFNGDGKSTWEEFWVTGEPTVADSIDDQTVYVGQTETINLESKFSGDDRLVYTANSPDHGVATVAVEGSALTVTGVAFGKITITVTAKNVDPDPLEASQEFTATVKVDHNVNNNELIDITNLDQLNAIRWDPDGDGTVDPDTSQEGKDAYAKAFPFVEPENADFNCKDDRCEGYELMTDLNFDVASSYSGGKVNARWSDPDENGAGWEPIPRYNGKFQGNGNTISKLFINSIKQGPVGLFGNLDEGGTITRLRLADVNVTSSGDSPGFDAPGTGGVVGNNYGEIKYSSVTGHVTRKSSSTSANNDAVGEVGQLHIVGGMAGENQGDIVASYAAVAVSGYESRVGGLVGQNHLGTITSSYATGKVSVDGDAGDAGGLVGNNIAGTIISSYASGDVIGPGDNRHIGGLVGFAVSGNEINASYSTSVVSGNGGLGGLIVEPVTRVLHSYWDTETSSVSNGERGKTTAELQTPTGYDGIYEDWNDLDGNSIADTTLYWHFGTASQYPALDVGDFNGDGTNDGWREFGHQVRERPDLTVELKEGGAIAQLSWTSVSTDRWVTPPRSVKYALYRREGDTSQFKRVPEVPPTATDHTDRTLDPEYRYSYQVRVLVNEFPARASNIVKVKSRYVMDSDGDGLIEVANLAQLNSIRYDSDGDGVPSPGGASDYRAAFKVMGNIFCSGPCRGYELKADLDFDTGTPDDRTDDAYYRSGSGWEPVDYDAVFEGNGYSISNLYINSTGREPVGLFGRLESGGLLNHVRLVDVDVAASGDSSVGGLVGLNDGGTIVASRVIGQIAATGAESVAGGLVGRNARGTIAGSYAASSVLGSADARGGLVGKNDGGTIIAAYATGSADGGGGLVGENLGGTIIAAYSTGVANGGLVATNLLSVTQGISSYWDTGTSGAVSSAGGRGKTTADLQGPTSYTGIYANWNVDIDNADKDGDPFTGGDNPWNFGGPTDYPTLNLSALGELSFVDRAALAEFYHATAGENWARNDNWLSDKPMSTWFGVDVNAVGRVTRVEMWENDLVGRLPASLGDLAKLERLVLGGNSLSGPLPPELGGLANLVLLDLKNNSEARNFKGGTPSGLDGPIPAELGNLDDLAQLYLHGNKFSGAVPSELGNLGSLVNLALNNNPDLTGQLPRSFTNLTSLRNLNFRDTGLCAPASLRQWTSGLEAFSGVHCK